MENSYRKYITSNNFDKVLQLLKQKTNKLSVLKILIYSLENAVTPEDEISVNPSSFTTEFNTGLDAYFLLSKSNVPPESFLYFKKTLWDLFEKIIAVIENLILEMKKVTDLNFEEDLNYYEYYEIRAKLQDLINHLNKKDNVIDKIRISKLKAKLSNLLDYEISKVQIGHDMLQLSTFYLDANQKEDALKIYKAILKDFAGGYSISISNGSFNTTGRTIVRLDEEIEIYDKARIIVEKLTGEEFPILVKQETIEYQDNTPRKKKTIWTKLKKLFRSK